MDGLDVLKVKFTHFNTVRDKKPYTIYEIEVRSSSTITWVIYKRYSGFYTLHQELQKMFENGKEGNIRLPALPPKRLTRSLAPEFVEKRKEELQEYLRSILALPVLLHSPVVLKFLEVPDSVRPMLARAPTHKLLQDIESKDGDEDKQDLAHKSYEERRVLELLSLLKRSHNRVAAIRDFEDYFFEHRPKLSNDYIRLLFQGKSGDGGLIETCGNLEYSHVASRAALNLLVRLLDVEKNKDALTFLDVFVALDPAILKQMKLGLHILSKRGNRLGAFRIVSILTSQRSPAESSSPDRPPSELSVDQVVSDPYAKQEYNRWAERKTAAQVAPFREAGSDKVSLPKLSEQGHKPLIQRSFEELLKIAQNQNGWKKVAALSPDEVDAAAGVDEQNRITIYYQKDPINNIVVVKIATIMRFCVDDVALFLADLRRRKQWDPKYHKGHRLVKVDANTDVVNMMFKSSSSPYKYRDFVLLRSMSKLDNGGYLLVARSILHSSAPEQKGSVRAILFPSGYILTPLPKVKALPLCPMKDRCVLKDAQHLSRYSHKAGHDATDRCLFTFVAQLDKEGVLIVSPDLLGETSELRDGITLIKECLRQDHVAKQGMAVDDDSSPLPSSSIPPGFGGVGAVPAGVSGGVGGGLGGSGGVSAGPPPLPVPGPSPSPSSAAGHQSFDHQPPPHHPPPASPKAAISSSSSGSLPPAAPPPVVPVVPAPVPAPIVPPPLPALSVPPATSTARPTTPKAPSNLPPPLPPAAAAAALAAAAAVAAGRPPSPLPPQGFPPPPPLPPSGGQMPPPPASPAPPPTV